MNIKINNWYGRLGNNISQLRNVIHIAVFYKYNIIIPTHKYFNTTYIKINNNITVNSKIKNFDGNHNNFFSAGRIKNIDNEVFNSNCENVLRILKSIFIIKCPSPIKKSSLIIHIRSGDIFSHRPHSLYVMPPFSYYLNIINNNNYDNIILIAEDTKNPCINALLKHYPKIIFTKQNLDTDIKIILSGTDIVMGYGTFIPCLILFSENIRKLYRPQYVSGSNYNNKYLKELNTTSILHDEYYKKVFPWKNTLVQQKIMLEYGMPVENSHKE